MRTRFPTARGPSSSGVTLVTVDVHSGQRSPSRRTAHTAEGGATTLLEAPTAERTYKPFPPPPPPSAPAAPVASPPAPAPTNAGKGSPVAEENAPAIKGTPGDVKVSQGTAEAERAKGERIPTERLEVLKLAPHLSESEVAAHPERSIHRLTLDRDIQAAMEKLATEQTKLLGPKLSAAVLVVDHATGEVLAHVGSAGYFDRDRQGAIDMTNAIRSPGSTLKPFIYGLAFENGIAHPELVQDHQGTMFWNGKVY